MNSPLLCEMKGGVAYLTLNRPEGANAINLELARQLDEITRKLENDETARAILISGAGKLFCAGGDLRDFAATNTPSELSSYLQEATMHLHRAISRLARIKSPVIAAIHGSAAGAGFSLACAVDFVIAAESAKFCMAYTRAGLTPDGSGTYFLPRIVGFRRALELAVLNPVLSAKQAMDLGIVTRVVPDADLARSAAEFADQLATGPTLAFRGVKRLLLNSATSTLGEQMGHETETICAMAWTKDGREGIASFTEKRPAKFTGE